MFRNDVLPGYGRVVLLLWENKNPYPRKRWISIGSRSWTDHNGEHYDGEPQAAKAHSPLVIGWAELPDMLTASEVQEQKLEGDFDE